MSEQGQTKLDTSQTLQTLSRTLLARRTASPETSYTARLMAKGPDAILKKIGEESAELIIAGKVGEPLPIICESADVLYHLMVLLAFHELSIEQVLQELARREGLSGLAEKAARPEQTTADRPAGD
ncbi:MAG: phosphoribosyl-ATP diphosphatase [Pseudomonadota bacterium]